MPAQPAGGGLSDGCNQSAHNEHAGRRAFRVSKAPCALAVTITDVPELSPGTIERLHLCDAQMVSVCAPSHPLAAIPAGADPEGGIGPVHPASSLPTIRSIQKGMQQGVVGERQWRVNDLGAKHDLLRGGLCWGHMPRHMVAVEDLTKGTLVGTPAARRWAHGPPHLHDLAAARVLIFPDCQTRLVDLASAILSALAKGYEPAPSVTQRQKVLNSTRPHRGSGASEGWEAGNEDCKEDRPQGFNLPASDRS